jgi:hypothetical protein
LAALGILHDFRGNDSKGMTITSSKSLKGISYQLPYLLRRRPHGLPGASPYPRFSLVRRKKKKKNCSHKGTSRKQLDAQVHSHTSALTSQEQQPHGGTPKLELAKENSL